MPSAFIFVLVEVLVMPEGVVMVLVLLMPAADLVEVLDLCMPAGLVMVDVLVVVVAGVCDVVVVVIFDELLLIVAGVVWAWAARPPVTSKAARNPKKRFMVWEEKWVKKPPPFLAENVSKCSDLPALMVVGLASAPQLYSRNAKSPALLLARGF